MDSFMVPSRWYQGLEVLGTSIVPKTYEGNRCKTVVQVHKVVNKNSIYCNLMKKIQQKYGGSVISIVLDLLNNEFKWYIYVIIKSRQKDPKLKGNRPANLVIVYRLGYGQVTLAIQSQRLLYEPHNGGGISTTREVFTSIIRSISTDETPATNQLTLRVKTDQMLKPT